MSTRTKANLEILAALFVLFSAMIDPRISVGIAVVALIALAIWEYRTKA